MSVYSFDCVIYALLAIYSAVAIVSLVQLVRLLQRDEGGIECSPYCIIPSTAQQVIHALIFALSTVRVGFFIVSLGAWDPTTGEVIGEKAEFYSLDEVANVLLFCVTSVLILFWAELYYISTNSLKTFTFVVRPFTYFINAAALIIIVVFSSLVSFSSASDVDYIFTQYTILISSIYLLAAVVFAYYANVAAQELKQVPILLSARKQRLQSLRILAVIVIAAVVVKASILIYLTNRTYSTITSGKVAGVFLFYFLCEVVPLSVILLFYRVEPIQYTEIPSEEDDDGDEVSVAGTMETLPLPLVMPPRHIHNNISSSSSASSARRTTASPLRSVTRNNQPEIIDAIIARLSVETGGMGEMKSYHDGDAAASHNRDQGFS